MTSKTPSLFQEGIRFQDGTLQTTAGGTRIVNKSSGPYTAVAGDIVLCDTSAGGFTVVYPLSSANTGLPIEIKKTSTDTNVLTLATSGSDTIDDDATKSIVVPKTCITAVANGGSVWEID